MNDNNNLEYKSQYKIKMKLLIYFLIILYYKIKSHYHVKFHIFCDDFCDSITVEGKSIKDSKYRDDGKCIFQEIDISDIEFEEIKVEIRNTNKVCAISFLFEFYPETDLQFNMSVLEHPPTYLEILDKEPELIPLPTVYYNKQEEREKKIFDDIGFMYSGNKDTFCTAIITIPDEIRKVYNRNLFIPKDCFFYVIGDVLNTFDLNNDLCYNYKIEDNDLIYKVTYHSSFIKGERITSNNNEQSHTLYYKKNSDTEIYDIESIKFRITHDNIYDHDKEANLILYICPEYCYECVPSTKTCYSTKNHNELLNILFDRNELIIDENIIANDEEYIIYEINEIDNDDKPYYYYKNLKNCRNILDFIGIKDLNLIIIFNNNNFEFLHGFNNKTINSYLFTLDKNNISICEKNNIYYDNGNKKFQEYVLNNRIEYVLINKDNQIQNFLFGFNNILQFYSTKIVYFEDSNNLKGTIYNSQNEIIKFMVQYENLEDIKFLPYGNNVYYIEKFKVGIYNGINSNENSLFTLYVCPEYCFRCDDLKECSSNKSKEEISQIILNKYKQIIDEKIINDYNITISMIII